MISFDDYVRERMMEQRERSEGIEAFLMEAAGLINGARRHEYGDSNASFSRIAAGWSQLLGTEVTPVQAALCMAWLKMSRLTSSPHHHDSYADAVGYIALAEELNRNSEAPNVQTE